MCCDKAIDAITSRNNNLHSRLTTIYHFVKNVHKLCRQEFMTSPSTQPIETWSELINLIQESVHPNHYLIFELKKTMISQLGSCKDLQFLENNLTYCQEVLTLVKQLDPGPER